MPRFKTAHFNEFLKTPFVEQAPFGKSPRAWAAATLGITDETLPDAVLTRPEVREQCSPAYSVLHGYMVAMAWGMQGSGMGGHKHAKAAWDKRETTAALLERLRKEKLTRAQAYEMFKGADIPGLGPSYFTKLIYYFTPGEVDRFICDQWTAKSINLLTGEHVVRMSGPSPTESNSGKNYEAFNAEIEKLAEHVNKRAKGHVHTGNDIEQMLFSLGSINKQPRHAWRAYVEANWEAERPAHRYDEAAVLARTKLP